MMRHRTGERRRESVQSAVTEAEKQRIADAAARAGETVSDWLRDLALREVAQEGATA